MLIVASLLAGSGILRLGGEVGSAFALAADAPEATTTAADECTTEEGVFALLEEVQKRESRITERESVVAERAKALEVFEERVNQRLQEMKMAEEELSRTIEIADRGAEDDVARLVTVYENMKPKQAVPLFETMDPEFAAGFLARMRPDSAALIMAGLMPDTAYSISVLMAGRNANAPKN
ncbi:hypothetical protein BFP70_06205 [Thioclava sp. SK-1]|nr:hypothetical protein BFP70_06205 [Thioclava sp. SK-1]